MNSSDFRARFSNLLGSSNQSPVLADSLRRDPSCRVFHRNNMLMALALMVICSGALATKEWVGTQQKLRYTVVYQGLLSSFIPIEIAEAELTMVAQGTPVVESMLQITSEPFKVAELFYPFRFAYQSWIDSSEGATLAALSLSRTRKRSKAEMLQFDADNGSVRRYLLEQTGDRPTSNLLDGARRAPAAGLAPPIELPGNLEALKQDPRWNIESPISFPRATLPMDRLAMLHWIRNQPLRPGIKLMPPVYNGDALRGYQVTVEAEETLQLGGHHWPAYRVKLQSMYNDDTEQPVVLLWLSADERRLPLRFLSKRPFGQIEVALREG